MPQDIIIISPDGRRRRARKGEVIQEGERIHFPATLMDAMANVMMADSMTPDSTIRDAHGTPAGHRPGYCFNNMRQARDAAETAYEERKQRLQNAWRNRGQHEQQSYEDEAVAPPTLDQARALAQGAWEDKKVRLANAWRNR